MDVVVFGVVEHAPACGGQQQPAADAEEREDVSAEQHRRDHDEPAVGLAKVLRRLFGVLGRFCALIL